STNPTGATTNRAPAGGCCWDWSCGARKPDRLRGNGRAAAGTLLRLGGFCGRRAARAANRLPPSQSQAVSFFSNVELVPGDPILGLTEAYNADTRATKVNLGVGIYYDEQGRIPLLKAVQQVEQTLAAAARPRGYLPIDGLPAYTQATRELLFGKDSPLLAAGRVATTQTVG